MYSLIFFYYPHLNKGISMAAKRDEKKSLPGRLLHGTFNRENIEAIIIAVILALFIRTFVVQAFKIPSGSMETTLLIGDHILVNKFIYGIAIPFTDKKFLQFVKPQRGDVIVFIYPEDPSKDFIKRVIAVEGDRLSIKDKRIFINGNQIEDPYGVHKDPNIISSEGGEANRDNFGPVTVPPHALFVMGDNRDRSYDSRFWGYVDLNKVKGKAFIIYWSWGGFFQDIRWNRIGKIIH
jgi:signal peptidase I